MVILIFRKDVYNTKGKHDHTTTNEHFYTVTAMLSEGMIIIKS